MIMAFMLPRCRTTAVVVCLEVYTHLIGTVDRKMTYYIQLAIPRGLATGTPIVEWGDG